MPGLLPAPSLVCCPCHDEADPSVAPRAPRLPPLLSEVTSALWRMRTTEHLLRSSSQERPLAKAKAGRPAGPPPPTAANLPSSVGDAAAAVGRETESSSGGGSGCGGLSTVGPAGPPAPTPATSVAPATPLRTCLDLPPTPFPTRASFRQALRGTLPPLFVELNVWRQHRLPRLRCLMQVRPFNFRRRLLACNTTSASPCRPRVSLPRPRDRGHKFGRPSPTSCPAAAGRWIFLRAASNILLPAGSALHFPANSGSLHVLLCALRPLVTTWTFATPPMSQLGLTTSAASPFTACVTVRQPLLLASFPCSIDLSWRPLRPHPQCIPRRLASLTLPLKLTWSMQLPLLRGNTSSGRRSSCRQAVRPPRMHANSLAVGALPRLVPATPVTPVQIAHLSISPASTGYTI